MKTKSTAPTKRAKIKEATKTNTELDCKSENAGHVTFSVTSVHDSLINDVDFAHNLTVTGI